MLFKAKNQVRMHDTDMAGILYFPRIFRFVHDTFEDFLQDQGINFNTLFNVSDFTFVVAHAEADYKKPITVGDQLEVHLQTENIGNTSFTMAYKIYKTDGSLIGEAKTVHVCLNSKTRLKTAIPESWRHCLEKYSV